MLGPDEQGADSELSQKVPRRLVATHVELTSNELMVLSLIDDRACVREIAEMLGAEPAQLLATLTRLVELQVIDLGASAEPKPVGSLEPARAELLDAKTAGKKLQTSVPAPAGEAAGPEQVVDLPLELQLEIEQVAERVFSSDPFVVLGCEPDTPREQLRQIYHAGIRRFHPDRYFGKELGIYKAKLERIFRRLTTAYEVLEASLAPPPRTSEPVSDAQAASPSIPPAPRAPSFREADPTTRASRSSQRVPAARDSAARLRAAGSDSEARRRALARKLGDGRLSRPSVAPHSSAESVAEAQRRSRDSLRRMRVDRASDPKLQMARYLRTVDEAEAEQDLITARNVLKIAASMDPENLELALRVSQLETAVAVKHADEYIQRGQVAERQEQWAEAAQMYERAAQGRPHNTQLLERAANCLLTENKDLGHALRLAKSAVMQAPLRVSHRVVLARIYLAGDMKKSAEGEFERAKALDAHDPQVRALGKELGRR